MALQPRIIACGNSVATFAMAVRFLTGPAVMAAASIAVGLRGTLLHVAIVQVNLLIHAPHPHNHIRLPYCITFTLMCITHVMLPDMFAFPFYRLHFHRALFPLCSPKSTTFIQLFSALRMSNSTSNFPQKPRLLLSCFIS